MNYIIVNGELTHYGVPGMKWGHRKASIVSTQKPRLPGYVLTEGQKPPKHEQDYIDLYGINGNTRSIRDKRKAQKKLNKEKAEANLTKGQKVARKALKTAGGLGVAAAAAGTLYVVGSLAVSKFFEHHTLSLMKYAVEQF